MDPGKAEDWPSSSARAHRAATDDGLATTAPVLDRYGDFAAFLGEPADHAPWHALRRSESSGRPVA